jgi:pyruvate,water dikinase
MIGGLSDAGVRVPGGFATTAQAYRDFLSQDGLNTRIAALLGTLDVDDVDKLAECGAQIREWILAANLPEKLRSEVTDAWQKMSNGQGKDMSVAVRSSATAEDLPEASFAGQQETLLNVRGLDRLLTSIHQVYASLYTDRAIAYRVHHGFDHNHVALSVGVQHMVRSDLASSGVMFTLDTESGFRDLVFITASYGLGETVVQGAVNPDEFYVYKPSLKAGKRALLKKNLGAKAIKMVYSDNPTEDSSIATVDVAPADSARFCLTDEDVELLARYSLIVEDHYGRPMDIEWAKDGQDGQLYLLQARPETVQSRNATTIQRFTLKNRSKVLAEGRSIGQRIGTGNAKIIDKIEDMTRVQQGDVLVADMTDPNWEPVMKRAAAIVTNRGGRTCHAAIIARELGIPAVVGCGTATDDISDGIPVTVSCAEGDEGYVYQIELDKLPEIPVKIMMNVANPDRAFDFANLPNSGVGLARLEFIINRTIGVHPKALLEFDKLRPDVQHIIREQMAGYDQPVEFFVEKLSEGIACIAAAFAPAPVIVRLSDFKSNEYANLIGGQQYEPKEENPMLGFRGASRYRDPGFQECFEMECRAIKRVREDMGLSNVEVMIPFVRTLNAACRPVSSVLRRHVDRFERHDTANAGTGQGFRTDRRSFRRTG